MKLKSGVIVSKEKDGYIAVVSDEARQAFNGMLKLNGTAAFIVDCLMCETDIEKLTDAMLRKYDVDPETARECVISTVQTLDEVGLLK